MKKRGEKMSQSDLDSTKKKKRRGKMSQGDLDSTKKKKRRGKMSQDDLDRTKNRKRREKKSDGTTKGYPHFWSWLRVSKCGLPAICPKNSHKGKSKQASSQEKKEVRGDRSIENKCDAEEETVEEIPSVDEDHSKGMKKWLLDYHRRRLGLETLQQMLDEFMASHEAEEEQARKKREALAAEGGWTVVVHHEGRKKTTDSESGIAVGSVAHAAVENKMAKKKQKELALDFYRFQKREAQRNEVMMLQSKFEQDKKRLQQLRAARKFRPY